MQRRDWVWMGALTFVLGEIAACGGGTEGSSTTGSGGSAAYVTTGTGPVALESLGHEMAAAMCNLMLRCFGSRIVVDDCDPGLEKTLEDQAVAQLRNAITAGRIVYDAAAMRTCLDQFAQLACDYSNQPTLSPACTNAMRGTVPLGGECTYDNECADGASTYCFSTGTCPGHCQTRQSLGQSCQSDSDCAENLGCSPETDTCVPVVKTGELCGASANNAECGGLTSCEQASSAEPWRCQSVQANTGLAEGETCSYERTCQSGLVCAAMGAGDGGTSYDGQCQKASTSGGPCRYSTTNPCPDGEYCSVPYEKAVTTTGSCTPRVTAGQACSATVPSMCPEGSWCSNSVCVVRQRLGGPCANTSECYSSHCTGGVCVAPQDCAD